ncbi:MAG: sulfite exporter TauE/SafE family protein [Gammaproteobacteria bacterium]|nr:MAG: sulfite exporter TauE/SafE family protein [Gammaproteobacteria bacterium]
MTPAQLLLANAVVFGGAILQAATGFGSGLVIVPLLALISFAWLPGPIVFGSMALALLMALSGWRDIRYRGIGVAMLGLAVGSVGGVIWLSQLNRQQLGTFFGVLILFAVLMTARGRPFALIRRNLLGAGLVSGFMASTSGFGAPPLALVYQQLPGPQLRATLGLIYFISSAIILLVLNLAGRFSENEALLGLWLMPGFVAGFILAARLAHWFDQGRARAAVLTLSTISAIGLIAKSVI